MLSRIHTEGESQKGGRKGKQEGGSNRERISERQMGKREGGKKGKNKRNIHMGI